MKYDDEEEVEYQRQLKRIQDDNNRIKQESNSSYRSATNSNDSFTYENADFEVDDEDEDDLDENNEDEYAPDEMDENESEYNLDDESEDENETEEGEEVQYAEQGNENGGNFVNKIKSTFTKSGGSEKAKSETAKKAGQSVAKGFAHFFKFLFTPPVLWYTLIVLAIILLIVIIVLIVFMAMSAAAAPFENTDVANGKFDTSAGVTGENFYGARVVYYDEVKAVQELNDYYYSFAIDYINKLDDIEGVDLSQEASTIVNDIQLAIANIVSPEEDKTDIKDLLLSINHFGYTSTELKEIKNYLLSSKDTMFIIDSNLYTSSLENDIETIFETNYSSLNITAPLYYVKDVILENDEAMISGLTQENYVAFIYMPKTNVNFEIAEYMFYIPYPEGVTSENYIQSDETNVLFRFYECVNGQNFVSYSNTIDPTWWDEDSTNETAEVNLTNPTVNTFNSIDTTNIHYLNGQSLYSVLVGNVGENSSKNNQENSGEELANNLVNFIVREENIAKYFTIIEISDEEALDNYKELSYLPSQDNNYIYLTFDTVCSFQFAEFSVDCEKINN